MILYQDSPDAMRKIVVCLVLRTIDAAAADINPFAWPHDWNLPLIFGNEYDAHRWVRRVQKMI